MSRVQSIERAFAVLGALADGPIGVTEVADRADLPKSTAARLLASLAREGVVEQVPGDTRYRLGPRLVTLAARIRPARSLAALARPSLEALAGSAGEAAGLSVRDGDQVHYIEQVGSPNPVSVRDWTGLADPAPRGLVRARSSSRSRHRPPSSATSAGRWSASRERTLVTADALLERMRAIRRDGYTWALEEFDEGISSVAAPVADASGEVVAAVHLHGPSYRFPSAGAETALADEVVATAARISGEPAPGGLGGGPQAGPGRCSSMSVWASNWAAAEHEPDRLDRLVADRREPMRDRRVDRDRVARLEDVLVEADADLEPPAQDVAPFVSGVALERVGRARGAADLVGHVEELDARLGQRRQAFPQDARREPDLVPVRRPLDRRGGGHRAGRRRAASARAGRDAVSGGRRSLNSSSSSETSSSAAIA